MADSFKVGEIAIFIKPGSRFFGSEVRVASEIRLFKCTRDYETHEWQYDVMAHTIECDFPKPWGDDWIARPEHLKKKKPPERLLFNRGDMDQKVSWDDYHKAINPKSEKEKV